MGSFLVSCGITNQSIQEDEEVYIIPICQRVYSPIELENGKMFHTHERGPHNTDFYQPVGFIFQGKYADYGEYEIDWSNKANQRMISGFLTHLKKHGIPVKAGDNQYHDIAVNFTDFESEDSREIWEKIQNAVWENRLIIAQGFRHKTPVQVEFFVVHKKHTDTLIEMATSYVRQESLRTGFSNVHTTRRLMSTREKFENLFELQNSVENERMELVAKRTSGIELSEEDQERIMELFNLIHDSTYHSYFCGTPTSDHASSHITSDTVARIVQGVEDKEERYEMFALFHTLLNVFWAMGHVNAHPYPVQYASQDYENEVGGLYASFMKTVSEFNEERTKQRREEDEDNDDDDE